MISLELTSFNKFLNFYIVISKKYTELIESQLYAQYPDVEIEVTTDYLSTQEQDNTAFVDIRLKKLSIHLGFEGGEAETLVLDCPLFKKRLNVKKQKKIMENKYTGRLDIRIS